MHWVKKDNLLATRLPLFDSLEQFGVLGQFRHILEAVRQALQEFLVEFVLRCGELIVAPQTFLPGPDQPSLTQVGQMARNLGLGSRKVFLSPATYAPVEECARGSGTALLVPRARELPTQSKG